MKINGFLLLLVTAGFLSSSHLYAQGTGIQPQYWNNLTIDLGISEKLLLTNTLSYNVLINKELPWSEVSNNVTANYSISYFLVGTGGLYFAHTKQSNTLTTIELRPYLGVKLFSDLEKRWIIGNLSRMELRNLSYSDNTNNSTFRFRNRTTSAIAINRTSMLEDNTLSIFAYVEAFHNFEKDVVERYFTTLKYKPGIAYRFSPKWRINIGALFNNARSTIVDPSLTPTNVVTNIILEWGVTYAMVK